MVAIPPAVLEKLDLPDNATVDIDIENGRIVMKPVLNRRYTLAELLAQCDAGAPVAAEDREWLDAPPTGSELI